MTTGVDAGNPLMANPWSAAPFSLPPLQEMKAAHFLPAFERDMQTHLAEIAAIVACNEPPTFENTVAPLDRAGSALDATSRCFGVLCASATYPELQKVEMEMAPVLANHGTSIYANGALFARLDAVHEARHAAQPPLSSEQLRCVERLHLDFVRAGARFDAAAKERYAAIVARLAELQTMFSQNLLADETEFVVELEENELTGCPADLHAAAQQAARERNCESGKVVITLSRSSVEPFLTFCTRRDLRERAWRAWTKRGELSPLRDNSAVAVEILRLRGEQAAMLGYESFAHYQTADTMARSPEGVMQLLQTVWPKVCGIIYI